MSRTELDQQHKEMLASGEAFSEATNLAEENLLLKLITKDTEREDPLDLGLYVNEVITVIKCILESRGSSRTYPENTENVVAREFSVMTGLREVSVYSTGNTASIIVKMISPDDNQVSTQLYGVRLYRSDSPEHNVDVGDQDEPRSDSTTATFYTTSRYSHESQYEIFSKSYSPNTNPQDLLARGPFVKILNECLKDFYLCLLTQKQEKSVDESKK